MLNHFSDLLSLAVWRECFCWQGPRLFVREVSKASGPVSFPAHNPKHQHEKLELGGCSWRQQKKQQQQQFVFLCCSSYLVGLLRVARKSILLAPVCVFGRGFERYVDDGMMLVFTIYFYLYILASLLSRRGTMQIDDPWPLAGPEKIRNIFNRAKKTIHGSVF